MAERVTATRKPRTLEEAFEQLTRRVERLERQIAQQQRDDQGNSA